MPKTYNKELSKLSLTKKIISFLPSFARFRIAKALYNYESANINGIDLVAPLQNEGMVAFINTKDIIGWKIFFFGEYETQTNLILKKYIKDDDIVIEAGANMGSETLLISKMLTKGHIYCFEPNPYVFNRLKINISINELANVDAYDCALGESDKQISFNIYPTNFCNAGMSSKYMETSNTNKITVTQKTLDSFVKENNIGKVDFIKMDIQGSEMDMINGAAATIAAFKPIIFTEACEPYNNVNQLYEKITQYGYNVYLIGENKMEPIRSAGEVKEGNWLAIFGKKNQD